MEATEVDIDNDICINRSIFKKDIIVGVATGINAFHRQKVYCETKTLSELCGVARWR